MQQTGSKEMKSSAWLGSKSDPLGIVQGIKTSPYWLILYAQTRICPRKWNP